jgi:predicted O-linked N-acetylglucosamine transferase (SPINDLY family)
MLTLYEHASPERLLAETKRWALSLSELNAKPLAVPPAQNGNRPLCIGIVCGSLQPRGLFDWLPSALSQGDPSRCEWTFYCEETKPGVISDALSAIAHQVVQTAPLSDEDLAALIESSQLDVLIDTIGHGHQTRLRVFAMKPAPIQVSWCAFPLTSGLKEMDYIWADIITIPLESEDFFTEQVIRFPNSLYCFDPPCLLDLYFAQEEADSRFSCGFLGLPETLTEAFTESLATVLSSIDDAEIVFIGPAYRDAAFQQEIRTRIARQSIEPSRIRFPFVTTAEEEFHAYQTLDVALSAFPVGSIQRALESLWMGVPVVTLLDERFSGRGVSSILNSLNKKEWIANTPSEYFEAVKQIADNRSVHRSQRQQLRSELLASPLCDIARMTQNIEGAVTEMVRRSRFPKVATTA